MVSRTRKTKIIRANKRKKVGAKRKARDRNHGSTPKFPIHAQKES